jgi:hypothetical protein
MEKSDNVNTLQFTVTILISTLVLYFVIAGLKFIGSARKFAAVHNSVIPGNSNGTVVQILLWFWIVTIVLEIIVSIGIYSGCISFDNGNVED